MDKVTWERGFLCHTVVRYRDLKRIGDRKSLTMGPDSQVIRDAMILDGESSDTSGLSGAKFYDSLSSSARNDLIDPIFKFELEGHIDISTDGVDSDDVMVTRIDNVRTYVWDSLAVVSWNTCGSIEVISDGDVERVERHLSLLGKKVVDLIFDRQLSAGLDELLAPEVLWTSRTMIVRKGLRDKYAAFIDSWASRSGLSSPKRMGDEKVYIGWGNCLIESYAENSKLIGRFGIANMQMQYLYASLEQVNIQLKPLLQRLAGGESPVPILNSVKQLEHSFFYTDYVILDFEHKLQGFDKTLFDDFMESWKISGLKNSIEVKLSRIRALATDLSLQRTQAVQHRISSLLVIIGVMEVLGALVELVHMANSEEGRSSLRFGLLSMIRHVAPDTILSAAMIILVLLSCLIFIYGAKEDR